MGLSQSKIKSQVIKMCLQISKDWNNTENNSDQNDTKFKINNTIKWNIFTYLEINQAILNESKRSYKEIKL